MKISRMRSASFSFAMLASSALRCRSRVMKTFTLLRRTWTFTGLKRKSTAPAS